MDVLPKAQNAINIAEKHSNASARPRKIKCKPTAVRDILFLINIKTDIRFSIIPVGIKISNKTKPIVTVVLLQRLTVAQGSISVGNTGTSFDNSDVTFSITDAMVKLSTSVSIAMAT